LKESGLLDDILAARKQQNQLKRKKEKGKSPLLLMVDGVTLLLVPCTIYIILDAIFIVAEYHQTKLVKKILSHNMRASMFLAPLLSVFVIHDTLAATMMNPLYHFFTSTM
jgi:hypothetical protein